MQCSFPPVTPSCLLAPFILNIHLLVNSRMKENEDKYDRSWLCTNWLHVIVLFYFIFILYDLMLCNAFVTQEVRMKCDNFAYMGISVSSLDLVLFCHSCAHCHFAIFSRFSFSYDLNYSVMNTKTIKRQNCVLEAGANKSSTSTVSRSTFSQMFFRNCLVCM